MGPDGAQVRETSRGGSEADPREGKGYRNCFSPRTLWMAVVRISICCLCICLFRSSVYLFVGLSLDANDWTMRLVQIMGRKANPDASYLEIEKSFLKKKGEIDYGEEITRDAVSSKFKATGESPRSPSSLPAPARPRSSADDNRLNLLRPTMDKRMKAAKASEKPIPASLPQPSKPVERSANKDDTSKVALRKPAPLQGDDIELEKPSKFRIKPNLALKMKKDPSESSSDVTLLKKPEVVKVSPIPPDQGGLTPSDSVSSSSNELATNVDTFPSSPTRAPKPSMPAKNDVVESAPESLNFSDGTAIVGDTDVQLSPEGDDIPDIGNGQFIF